VKLLELSPNEQQAKEIWKDAEITPWDFSIPTADNMLNCYDIVFANNVLQRFSYMAALNVLKGWEECLADGGELHVIVPSLEWACREVLHERPSPACMISLFGGQGGDGSVHMSGFTMRLLRADFEKIGLGVFRARTGPVTMGVNGVEMTIEQHYIAGRKGAPVLKNE
jgi:hypothetical protein